MSEAAEVAGSRDRSPAYPNVSLKTALERLVEFDQHFKRSPARPEKMGDAWGIKGKAYVDRITAALRYFGLLEYQTVDSGRQIVVSEEGRKFLRSQQEETKREVIRAAALRPKQIAKYWKKWGADRPADAACIDELLFQGGFSDKGAKDFLKVYDSTISLAGLSDSDKSDSSVEDELEGDDDQMVQADITHGSASKTSHQPMPSFPAGVEMQGSKDEYNLITYSTSAGSRIRISADLDLKGAKRLQKLLTTRIKMMEEEEAEEDPQS